MLSNIILAPVPKSIFTTQLQTVDTTVSALGGWTFIDRTAAIPNNTYITGIGIQCNSSHTGKVKICKRNSANNYDIVVDQSISHAGAGWQDFNLTSLYLVPGSGTYYLGAFFATGGTNPDYKGTSGARAFVNSDLTGTGVATTGEDPNQCWALRFYYTY